MAEFSFSEWLRNEMNARGLTVNNVAEITGLTTKAIYQYLRVARIPSILTATDIMNSLGKRIMIVDKKTEETKKMKQYYSFTFSKWLDQEIKAQRITQATVARIAGLDPALISVYRSGKRIPGIIMANDIINSLGCHIEIVHNDKKEEDDRLNRKIIKDKMPVEELVAGLAEECSELAQVALKLRRIWDKKNPTPCNEEETIDDLHEEIADVLLYISMLDVNKGYIENIMKKKMARWEERLRECE